MNTSAFISVIVVALASYAAAMPVPDGETDTGGKAGVSFPFPISHILTVIRGLDQISHTLLVSQWTFMR